MDSKLRSSGSQRYPELSDAPTLWRSAFKPGEELMKPDSEALEGAQTASQKWMTHRAEDFQRAVEPYRQTAERKDFEQASLLDRSPTRLSQAVLHAAGVIQSEPGTVVCALGPLRPTVRG